MGRYRINHPDLPASPDQILFAEETLRVPLVPHGVTMGRMSEIIDAAQELRKPTTFQRQLAEELGIAVPDDMTFNWLRDLITDKFDELTTAARRTNPLLKAGETISYARWPFRIEKLVEEDGKLAAKLVPVMEVKCGGYHPMTVPVYKLAKCGAPTPEEADKPYQVLAATSAASAGAK